MGDITSNLLKNQQPIPSLLLENTPFPVEKIAVTASLRAGA